uniref:Arginine/serine-rich protein PNISR n=1 Tax=Syphacia muris TaxID=451379 RepID=A0A0N5AI82_9BILA
MGDNNAKWMEQSYYDGIPHSEVNWAELAQNWMAMQMARSREGNADESSAIPPPPPPVQRNCPQIDMPLPPSNPQFIPPIPFFPPVPMDPGAFGNPSAGWAPPLPGSLPPGAGPFPPFIPPHPPWSNPPGGAFRPSSSISASSFPHREGNEKEGAGNLAEYYEKWDDKQQIEQKQYDSENEDSSGIPQGAMAHWLAPPNHWPPPGNWVRRGQDGSSMDMSFIDQRTRKALPAWIREGLEKAEKEKQKKLEKEMKMRIAEEAAKARRLSKGLGKFVSYFADSDSSDDEGSKKDLDSSSNGFQRDGEPVFLHGKLASKRSFLEKNGGHHVVKNEEVDLRTEEEKREDAVGYKYIYLSV